MKNTVILLALSSLWNCGGGTDPGTAVEAAEQATLSQGQLDLARIELGQPERKSFSEALKCSGTVEVPPQNRVHVHAPMKGFVKEVRFKPGHKVRKGDLLVRLEHAALIHLQQRFLEAAAQFRADQMRLERTASLARTEAASTQSFEQARADYQIAQARFEGLKAELEFLGIPTEKVESEGAIQTFLPIYSPTSGIIESVEVNMGELVQPEDPLYLLVDLSHTHLELQVFAADLPKVRIGQRIEAVVPGTADTLLGEVFLIGPSINPEKGTAMVHGHFSAGSSQAAPGAVFRATILSEPAAYWAVPEEALVRQDQLTYLFRREGNGWAREKVEAGISQKGWVALPGWKPDPEEEYVLKGAYYLKQLDLD